MARKDKPILYYAHSMRIYGTEQEKSEMALIKQCYPDYRIINPNGDVKPDGTMAPYIPVVKKSTVVVCSEYAGFIGKGVYIEVDLALRSLISTYVIDAGALVPVKSLTVYDPSDWKVRYALINT